MRLLPAAGLALIAVLLFGSAALSADCILDRGLQRAVIRVVDGETLVLDDGSEVRLVGALSPRLLDASADEVEWPPEREAKAELERIALGKSVELGFVGTRADRYGRHLAQVFVIADGRRIWVQEHMVRAGHARAYSLPDNAACLEELVAIERNARERGSGLWANAAYQVRPAERTRALLRYRSTFQIVEGRVESVADVRGQIFLNFGSDWREDFTVRVRPSDRRSMQLDFKAMQGRRVQVRGWIDRRSGPSIELRHAGQIEVLPD